MALTMVCYVMYVMFWFPLIFKKKKEKEKEKISIASHARAIGKSLASLYIFVLLYILYCTLEHSTSLTSSHL